MSDPRKPDTVISVRIGQIRHKLELFTSSQFTRTDMQDQPQHDENSVPTVRIRHNGQWLPPGSRQLVKLDDVMDLIQSVIGKQLKANNE